MNSELHKLFVSELQDMYDAEHQLLKALPKLASAANSEELREIFQSHLQETEHHVHRLERVFSLIEEKPKRKKCQGLEGLIAEGERLLSEEKGSEMLDAALISAAQKTEHYEIASYGCLCTWAKIMDHKDSADLLQQTLDEEKSADQHLTTVAESANHAHAR